MKLKFLFLAVFSLFLFGFASAQDIPVPVTSVPAKGYMLGPGDEVTAKVSGESDYDFVAVVNDDGKIEVPFYDKPILVKCRTEREVSAEVRTILTKYLRNPLLSLRATEKKSRMPTTISGEVNAPQQLVLMRKVTLMELLGIVGGAKEEAGGVIQVFRTQQPMCAETKEDSNWKMSSTDPTEMPSRMYSLANLKSGREEDNPVIYPGDVVMVHKAIPIYVTGEVVAPQGIYLKEGGLSLTEAIAKIGGVRREAKTKDIKIYRLKTRSTSGDGEIAAANKDQRDVISANYDLIRKGQQKDIMLMPFDIVEVDKAKESVTSQILKFAIGAGKAVITSGATNVGYRVIY